MLNLKKTITISGILLNTFVFLVSLVFVGSSFAESEIARGQGIVHPSLIETSDGTLHCAYAEGLELKYAVSTDGGQTWTIDTIPTPTAYYYGCCGIKFCQLAIDSNGSIYILYTDLGLLLLVDVITWKV